MGNVREAPALAYTSVRIKSVRFSLAAASARSGTHLLEVVLVLFVVGHGWVVGVRDGEKNERGRVLVARGGGVDGRGGLEKDAKSGGLRKMCPSIVFLSPTQSGDRRHSTHPRG